MKRRQTSERPSTFISHSSKDMAFARRLGDRLRGQGVDVWLDDLQLRAGDALTDTISQAVKANDFVVVVLSRASLASAWVRKEMALAAKRASRSRRAKLVPVLLEHLKPTRLPKALRDTKYVDFSDHKQFELGLAQLLDLMGRGSPAVRRRAHLEQIEFIHGDRLSAALRRNIERMLVDYQLYLRRLGFRSKFGAFEMAFERTKEFISYYDAKYDRVVTNETYAGEEDYLRRDYTHHALSTTRPELWSRGDRDWRMAAIESGLASYFPCSFKGNHLFGDGAAHIDGETFPFFDLTNTRPFSEIKSTTTSVATAGLEIWGGVFWQLRAQLGARIADRLLWRVWLGLRVKARRADVEFHRSLIELDDEIHDGRHVALIKAVFCERGLRSGRPAAARRRRPARLTPSR